MRNFSGLSVLLLLGVVSACDAILPDSGTAPEESAVSAVMNQPASLNILETTKASGEIIYEGGSRGVEVPKPLVSYFTTTGSVSLTGSLLEPVSTGKTNGASFAVSSEAEQKFSGKTISIKVVSSSTQDGEAFLSYSTNEVGNSGWVAFPVTVEDSVATIDYTVAPMVEGLGDFIGIDPNGNEVTIKAIVVEVVS